MTLEELREACAKAAANEAEHADGADGIDTANRAADAIRAIPLPAPVDDEFAGHTPEPWDYRTKTGAITDRDGAGLASVESGDAHEVDANGHLMAAAPRLLRERDEAKAELARVQRTTLAQVEMAAVEMALEAARDAKVAEDWPATEADSKALGDRVRAIPLPAPVDEVLALRRKSERLRAAVSEVLGAGHVLKAAIRMIEIWADDPVFQDKSQRQAEMTRASTAVTEYHRRLVAALKGECE